MRILGIETSCDETAASVVEQKCSSARICSNIIFSQISEHLAFGGIVPEIAARAHTENLDYVIERALMDAETDLSEIDAIAVTAGPGLIGGLIVGLMTAKALALVLQKPLFPINHLEGHALVARLTHQLDFPYLLLLVSGGHTQILLVQDVGHYQRWASTLDDALGEVFDKVARMLRLSHPGGPGVEQYALLGDPSRFVFPCPMKGAKNPNFSFSGLKSSVWRTIDSLSVFSIQDSRDICASFQQTVIDSLMDRVLCSMQRFQAEYPLEKKNFVVAGGVAANKKIRQALEKISIDHGFSFVAPSPNLCGDNAAMIAWAALERMNRNLVEKDAMHFLPRSRWPLDDISSPVLGFGKRGTKA